MGMYTLIVIHFQKYVLLFLTYNPKLKEQQTLKIMNWFTKRKELEEILTMVGKGTHTEILKVFTDFLKSDKQLEICFKYIYLM